jgi:hypothetical protein
MRKSLPDYFPARAYSTHLKDLLTPKHYVDWMALNLYLHLLVLDQSVTGDVIGHIPWDMIDVRGMNSRTPHSEVMGEFEVQPFCYPRSWVCKRNRTC